MAYRPQSPANKKENEAQQKEKLEHFHNVNVSQRRELGPTVAMLSILTCRCHGPPIGRTNLGAQTGCSITLAPHGSSAEL